MFCSIKEGYVLDDNKVSSSFYLGLRILIKTLRKRNISNNFKNLYIYPKNGQFVF